MAGRQAVGDLRQDPLPLLLARDGPEQPGAPWLCDRDRLLQRNRMREDVAVRPLGPRVAVAILGRPDGVDVDEADHASITLLHLGSGIRQGVCQGRKLLQALQVPRLQGVNRVPSQTELVITILDQLAPLHHSQG